MLGSWLDFTEFASSFSGISPEEELQGVLSRQFSAPSAPSSPSSLRRHQSEPSQSERSQPWNGNASSLGKMLTKLQQEAELSHQTPSQSGESESENDLPSPEVAKEAITGSLDAAHSPEAGEKSRGLRRRWAQALRFKSYKDGGKLQEGDGNHFTATKDFRSTVEINPEADVLIRGTLFLVKGWWRKGPSLIEKFVEIRRSADGKEKTLTCARQRGSSQVDIRVSINGAAAAAEDIRGLHILRLYPSPCSSQDTLDFLVAGQDERHAWLEVLEGAVRHEVQAGMQLAATVKVEVKEAIVASNCSGSRRQAGPVELYAVVRCGNASSRTPPQCREDVDTEFGRVVFEHSTEFPLTDDDPDALVTVEVWGPEGRSRHRPYGRVDIPLFRLGRNRPRDFHLSLRDPQRSQENGIGTITLKGQLNQDLFSMLLPRALQDSHGGLVWQCLGDKKLKEQYQELTAFFRTFQVFSNRFAHHSDSLRSLSFTLRTVVHWDRPSLTLASLCCLTILLLFFHEYIVPLAAFCLLCTVLWHHPWCRRYRTRCVSPEETSLGLLGPCSRLVRSLLVGAKQGSDAKVKGQESSVEAETHFTTSEQSQSLPEKERWENERRLVWGKFTSQRLHFWDPPPWTDAAGRRAEPPQQLEGGLHYVWQVEVNRFTDNEGWRYAASFSKHAVWRNAFLTQTYVRRRRYVGRPGNPLAGIASSPSAATSFNDAGPAAHTTSCSSSMNMVTVEKPCNATGSRSWVPWKLSRSSSSPLEEPLPAPSPTSLCTLRLTSDCRPSLNEGGGKGPEFGIAKTPFHDMYQQYFLKWAHFQKKTEYWMDWYERRKNLLLGVTLPTQNFALAGVLVVFLLTLVLPTRILVLTWIYSLFFKGYSLGKLMREHQHTFIRELKDTAEFLWLETDEGKARIHEWGPETTMDELADTVQMLKLREWIKTEFYNGQPMIPLRAVQRCRTLRELATLVTWTSEHFPRRRKHQRVWYKSTFRNLLDHVPTDVTRFQPLTFQGTMEDDDW